MGELERIVNKQRARDCQIFRDRDAQNAKAIKIAFPDRKSKALRIFQSNQQTVMAQEERERWLGGRMMESLRASMPPFNKPRRGVVLPALTEMYEVPVFGLRILSSIMKLFELPEVVQLAQSLDVEIPEYCVANFVQGKMGKVFKLIEVARRRPDCASGTNAKAVDRLSRFVGDFQKLKSSEIGSAAEWERFVNKYADEGWMDRLHFDHLLLNFGFQLETSKDLQSTEIDDMDRDGSIKKVTLEQYSLRWLGKAFAGYNVPGCLTDVANLVFAMRGAPPTEKLAELEIVEIISSVTQKVKAKDFSGLWVPTHMIHDAEVDDQLRGCCSSTSTS